MAHAFPSPFNSTFETGVRTTVILQAASPDKYDIERLTTLDHLVVHTGDLGGPASLHPPVASRWAELVVRRGLVQNGIKLMMLKGLIRYHEDATGIYYSAGNEAATFVYQMRTEYARSLTSAADWLINFTGDYTRDALRTLAHRQFERWALEFQARHPHRGSEK